MRARKMRIKIKYLTRKIYKIYKKLKMLQISLTGIKKTRNGEAYNTFLDKNK